MPRLKSAQKKKLDETMDAFSADLQLLLEKHGLDDLHVKKLNFGPPPPASPVCRPPHKWKFVCTEAGVCTWQCV
jgi:hypothetical protein